MAFQVRRRSDDDTVIAAQPTCDKARIFQKAGADRHIDPFLDNLDAETLLQLREIYDELKEQAFSSTWLSWIDMEDPKASLEYALTRLAFFEYAEQANVIEEALDQLAEGNI